MSAIAPGRSRSARFRRFCAVVLATAGLVACGESDDEGQSQEPVATADGGAADAADGGAVDELLIRLEDGELQGDKVGDARRFLSIPFAKPPVGELRWKAPVPNDPWTGVRHSTEFVKGCPQLADQGAPASDNEDCLYLNVWAPSPAPKAAPVMVWIHGGGNFSGGAGIRIPVPDQQVNIPWYDGQVFAAKQGVVLVTIQYRLGPLGFFAHPALASEGSPAGNQGLLDQRRALEWVKKNISKFGGDPGNVTIFGESAGSADVCYHVASPGSWPLFHKAISQSGGCTIRSVGPEQTPEKVGPGMVAYAKAVGCEEGPGQLACLRAAPVDKLLANAMQPMPGAGGGFGGQWSFAAVLDGPNGVLPRTPQEAFDSGQIANVPYLLGANNDEGTTFVIRATPLNNEADYLADLRQRYGESAAAQVAALYPAAKFGGNFNLARAATIGDSGVTCSTHDTARRAAQAGRKVFMYNFNVWWSLSPELLRAGHAAEINHVFGTPYLPMPDPASEQVAAATNTYWAQFAKTGNPNGPGAPKEWPEFRPDADKRLQLDTSWAVLDNFRTEECAFWRKYHGVDN